MCGCNATGKKARTSNRSRKTVSFRKCEEAAQAFVLPSKPDPARRNSAVSSGGGAPCDG